MMYVQVLLDFFPSGNTEEGFIESQRNNAGGNSWVFSIFMDKRNFKWESCLIRFIPASEASFVQFKF